MLRRLAAAAPLLRRSAVASAGRPRFMGAVTADIDKNLGRTPERTAELERLAEENNGFLFGEVVRCVCVCPSEEP